MATLKLTNNADAPPDLGDLVRAVIEGPPPRDEAASKALAAKPKEDGSERGASEGKADTAQPSETLYVGGNGHKEEDEDLTAGAKPDGDEEEDEDPAAGVEADDEEEEDETLAPEEDEAPTAEFQPVPVVKATKMYNPSVDKLIDRLEEVKVLSEEESIRARIKNARRDLKNATADLRGTAETMLYASEKAIAEAEAVCQEVYTLLDLLHDKYPELIDPRQPLVDGLGFLERLIEERRPESPEEAEINEERLAEELGIKRLAEMERQQRRRSALVFAVMLLAAARIGWGFFEGRVKTVNPVVTRTRGNTAFATNNAAGAKERELKEGIPSVVELALAQLEDGTLQTQVLAFDPDGQPLSMTYRWYENGKLIATTQQNELDAKMVKRTRRYVVRVTADDGRHFSAPVSTPPLLARRGAWHPPSKKKKKKTSKASANERKRPTDSKNNSHGAAEPAKTGKKAKRRPKKRKQRKTK